MKKKAIESTRLYNRQYRLTGGIGKNFLYTRNNRDACAGSYPYESAFIFCNRKHITVRQVPIPRSGSKQPPLIIGRIIYRTAMVETEKAVPFWGNNPLLVKVIN